MLNDQETSFHHKYMLKIDFQYSYKNLIYKLLENY